jgi:hypothetical protein
LTSWTWWRTGDLIPSEAIVMTVRTLSRSIAVLAACSALAVATSAAAQPVHGALDHEAIIAGIGVACTGIGQTKNDPKWQAYPVLVEFAGPGGELLADETMTLSDASGPPLLTVSCEGPWILLKLPPDKAYRVDGQVGRGTERKASGTVKAPSHGQARFVLSFPPLGDPLE